MTTARLLLMGGAGYLLAVVLITRVAVRRHARATLAQMARARESAGLCEAEPETTTAQPARAERVGAAHEALAQSVPRDEDFRNVPHRTTTTRGNGRHAS